MKFIRVHGRVVPIKGDGSAPKGSGVSKRYGAKTEKPKAEKSIGVAKGAAIGAAFGAVGTFAAGLAKASLRGYASGNLFKGAAIGAIAGAVAGSVKIYKKARGESSAQMAKRAGKYK